MSNLDWVKFLLNKESMFWRENWISKVLRSNENGFRLLDNLHLYLAALGEQ
jgi:hypothetical protein